MKKSFARSAALATLALVAACATPSQRGTEVTRFHLGQAIPAQAINVEPADPEREGSLEFRQYASIVAQQLATMGFTETGLEEAEMIAVIDVERGTREEVARRSPFTIGIGGGSFGRRTGVGVGTSFGVGGSRGGEVDVTELSVALKRRSEGTIVWEGTATRATEPGEESPAAIVEMLAAALFQGFPGESGRTITVE
ncbi:DUF4136 domain-containing protein [Parasphingopyxis algicola]|uniref:DUF4136 domain-containing protein n=1 Tax=Parasphingopyxis algicola TaxID=2026624 RepID=UPI00159FED84|nr:DUF4136 domain-containing protein [Parasphingopyxis algicola]QLC25484.1 DUF4136 domain-containing protein [Parasphingopyxis algicola]